MSNVSSTRSTPGWPDVAPPVAPREDREIQQLGRTRVDAYAWMRFIPTSGTRTLEELPPRLREHLEAEMRYADEILAPLAPDVDRFYERMAAMVPEVVAPLPLSARGWRYDFRLPAGRAHRVFSRVGPHGDTQTLFDEAERAEDRAYYRATGHQPSPDDRYFAWAEDIIGDDRHRICVLDVASGAIRTIVQADAFGYGGFVFAPSSRYLFWIWRDAHSRPTRLYRTPVDGGEAVLIYEERDPAIFMQVARTAANGFVALTLLGPDVSEVHLISADAETAAPRLVRARQRGIRYEINQWNHALLMLTDADGATDRKLLEIDPQTFAERRVLVPHRAHHAIVSVLPFADALVRLERVEGLQRLVLTHPDGNEQTIAFDEPAYTIALAPSQPYAARQVRIVHQTPASPPRWMDMDFSSGQARIVGQERLQGFDPAAYRIERLHAQAPDGVMVPITVLRCVCLASRLAKISQSDP